MELKITKEKVLEAASKCSTAKQTLQLMFPEVFEMLLVSKDTTSNELYVAKVGEDIAIHVANGIKCPRLTEKTHFILNSLFDWRIEDYNGAKFLIPTKK